MATNGAVSNGRALFIVHAQPDTDCIVPWWLFNRDEFASAVDKLFPGIDRENMRLAIARGGGTPLPQTIEEMREIGQVCVDCGGGDFDHHQQDPESGQCAATLLARALEIDNDPRLNKILQWTAENDLNGSGHFATIEYVIKGLHRMHPDDPMIAVRWAMQALDACFQRRVDLLSEQTAKDYEQADKFVVNPRPGKKFLVVVGQSDSRQLASYARGKGASVVVQQQTDGLLAGNVQITTNHQHGIVLYDVAAILRVEEARAREKPIPGPELLGRRGRLNFHDKHWYFHETIMALFNGSDSVPGVEPTRLSLAFIGEAVRAGIDYGHMPDEACEAGADCQGESCPWHPYHLGRCRDKRRREEVKARSSRR